ncbi:MAG TPA: AAA family ATPase [Candidatus Lokiarchaeia archaeon]|nr:AAA family ATPase [Candidatus Lokiarchaeia archaeon]
MIAISQILTELDQMESINFKVHLGTGGKKGNAALEAFCEDRYKEFQENQFQRNFERNYILSLAYYKLNEWLFCGIYQVVSSHPEGSRIRYVTQLTNIHEDMIGRLIIFLERNTQIGGQQSYPNLENIIDRMSVSEIRKDRITIEDIPEKRKVPAEGDQEKGDDFTIQNDEDEAGIVEGREIGESVGEKKPRNATIILSFLVAKLAGLTTEFTTFTPEEEYKKFLEFIGHPFEASNEYYNPLSKEMIQGGTIRQWFKNDRKDLDVAFTSKRVFEQKQSNVYRFREEYVRVLADKFKLPLHSLLNDLCPKGTTIPDAVNQYNLSEYEIKTLFKCSENDLRTLLAIWQPRTLNYILFGQPGTGKTYCIPKFIVNLELGRKAVDFAQIKEADICEILPIIKNEERFKFLTFHQSYSYEDFIEGLKPVLVKKNRPQSDESISEPSGTQDVPGDVKYDIIPGVFKEFCFAAKKNLFKNYYFVIDEINRGNISKIFGELITLIEEDKRDLAPNMVTTYLPYSKKPFSIPPNIYIIGTMNTADRSIAMIDVALRRRFTFIEMPPIYNLDAIPIDLDGINVQEVLRQLNERICVLVDPDHQLGHGYFTSVKTIEDLVNVWYYKIIPLLQEYCFNDWEKLKHLLGEFPKGTEATGFIEKIAVDGLRNYNEDRVYYKIHNFTMDLVQFTKVMQKLFTPPVNTPNGTESNTGQ